MNALQGYRKLFAPVIPGQTDTVPIYAAYEQMRQAGDTRHTILLFVECQTIREFREALAGCEFESPLSGACFQRQNPSVPINPPAPRP